MKIFKYIFYVFWRCWFYGWSLFIIILALPILLVVTSSEKLYPAFFKLAKVWANIILFVMGFKISLNQEQKFESNKSYMLCPNHTSMIDIMLMFSVAKNPFVFVGKASLAKIPIFGFFYKRTCIIVDRSSNKSRRAVFDEARRRLSNGLDVCIFPEGLVPDDESVVLSEFKKGAFRLAIEYQIPIVPMSFYDCKKRFSFTFFSGSPGKLRTRIHEFIPTKGLTLSDCDSLKDKTFDLIYNDLISDQELLQKSN